MTKSFSLTIAVILSVFSATVLVSNGENRADESVPFDMSELKGGGPGNEWGAYYNVNFTQEKELFLNLFGKVRQSECNSGNINFNRYFKSTKDPNLRIYSYLCQESDGYEHLKVDVNSQQLLEFQRKLSAFGINDAGEYKDHGVKLKGNDAKQMAKQVWDGVWNKFDIPKECSDPSVDQTDEVEMKSENYLMYYRFYVYCAKGFKYMLTEFFQDDFYGTYMEGKPTICFMNAVTYT